MYNVKVYDYGNERQYRFYSKAYSKSANEEDDKKKKEKEQKKEDNNFNSLTKNSPSDNDRSITSSLNRTVNKIYEYARSNEWDYFVTLTLNNKVDRYNFSECSKCIKSFIDDIRRLNPNMKYILVPELHKDGAYHFHGVFSNISNINIIDSGIYSFGKYTFKRENIPSNLMDKCRLIYNMGRYNYGYSDIQKVEDSAKTANYITKYITKELVVATKGKKRYWTSRNLNKPIVTELLCDKAEREELKEMLEDYKIHEKTVNVEVGDFKNKIEYIDVKVERNE